MNLAIGALPYHTIEFKETKNCHLSDPRGFGIWCKYQIQRNTNKQTNLFRNQECQKLDMMLSRQFL